MDIAQNSLSAGATLIGIDIAEDPVRDELLIRVTDNGKGMDAAQISRVEDPFYTTRTTRKVGLGIPLFKMEAEMTGGSFEIHSVPGEGTAVTARFVPSHVDMIPLGDIDGTVQLLICGNPGVDFLYSRSCGDRNFTLDTRELREVLGTDVTLDAPEVLAWIHDYLSEQTKLIKEEET